MPYQYENYASTRHMMSVLRSCWTVLYMWIMMHASAVVPIVYTRWEKGFLWNSRLPDQLVIQDPLSMIPNAELIILLMIAAVIRCLYVSFRYSLFEPPRQVSMPRLESSFIAVPYVAAFLILWIVTTYITASQVIFRNRSDTGMYFYGPCVLVLLFKLLIMANFVTIWLSIHVHLSVARWDWLYRRDPERNFAAQLNMIFRNG